MLKVKVSPASGSLTLGVTGALAASSRVVMLALVAVGGFPGGCPLMTPTMIAIRAARDMSPSRNFWIAARMMLSMDWSPFYRRINHTAQMRVANPQHWVRRDSYPDLGTAKGSREPRCILCVGPDHRRKDGRCAGDGTDRTRGDGRGRPGDTGAYRGLDRRAGFVAARGRVRDRCRGARGTRFRRARCPARRPGAARHLRSGGRALRRRPPPGLR